MTFLLLAGGLALAVAVAVVWVGRRAPRLGRVLAVALSVVAAVWVGGIALIATGWNDVDGWVDCHDCHGWHLLGALLFWTPPVLALMLLLVVAVAAVVARRERFSTRQPGRRRT